MRKCAANLLNTQTFVGEKRERHRSTLWGTGACATFARERDALQLRVPVDNRCPVLTMACPKNKLPNKIYKHKPGILVATGSCHTPGHDRTGDGCYPSLESYTCYRHAPARRCHTRRDDARILIAMGCRPTRMPKPTTLKILPNPVVK